MTNNLLTGEFRQADSQSWLGSMGEPGKPHVCLVTLLSLPLLSFPFPPIPSLPLPPLSSSLLSSTIICFPCPSLRRGGMCSAVPCGQVRTSHFVPTVCPLYQSASLAHLRRHLVVHVKVIMTVVAFIDKSVFIDKKRLPINNNYHDYFIKAQASHT